MGPRYKVCWTPETSDLVHGRVAKRLVDCLRRNEGLYVKFGQAMSTMDAWLHWGCPFSVAPFPWNAELAQVVQCSDSIAV
jgi:hypothetical protein